MVQSSVRARGWTHGQKYNNSPWSSWTQLLSAIHFPKKYLLRDKSKKAKHESRSPSILLHAPTLDCVCLAGHHALCLQSPYHLSQEATVIFPGLRILQSSFHIAGRILHPKLECRRVPTLPHPPQSWVRRPLANSQCVFLSFFLETGGKHIDTENKHISQTLLRLNVVYRAYFGNWTKEKSW